MSDTIKGKGSCLCGAVHINVNSINKNVSACHCGRFIDRKPSFYSFANKTTNMTEAEFYEMYSSSDDNFSQMDCRRLPPHD